MGSGYVVYNKGKRIQSNSSKLTNTTTVFQADITAINEAADYLIGLSNHRRFDLVKILSDSQAALTALKITDCEKRKYSAKQPKVKMQNSEASLDQSPCGNTRE